MNTLNSIRFMAQMSGYDGTRRMAQALGNIVSCSFRSSTSFYTVDEELQMLDSYLYIMRIRYADGFEVRYDVAEDCRSCRLPRLTLQPIVENALDHGFADMGDELGQLVIQAARQGDFLCLEVEDNGCGMTPEQVDAVLRGRPLGGGYRPRHRAEKRAGTAAAAFWRRKQPVDRECARPGHPDNDPPTLAGGSAPGNEGGTVP